MRSPSGQQPKFIAFVYPGWHEDSYRPSVDEWALLDGFKPAFPGHIPPPQPLHGRYDDALPEVVAGQIDQARAVGISGFLYFAYFGYTAFVMDKPMAEAIKISDAV